MFLSIRGERFHIEEEKKKEHSITHQHADVHGQIDFPSTAVVRSRSQTRYNPLRFADVTRCVVGVNVSHTCQENQTLSLGVLSLIFTIQPQPVLQICHHTIFEHFRQEKKIIFFIV